MTLSFLSRAFETYPTNRIMTMSGNQVQGSELNLATGATGDFLVADGAYSIRYEAEHYLSPSRRNTPLQVRTGASSVKVEGRLVRLARVGGRFSFDSVTPGGPLHVASGAAARIETARS